MDHYVLLYASNSHKKTVNTVAYTRRRIRTYLGGRPKQVYRTQVVTNIYTYRWPTMTGCGEELVC